MESLRGPLYLDVAAKGLSLAGIALMIFAEGGWFTAGMFMVLVGVLIGAWAVFAARRVRSPGGPARPAPFGTWSRRDAGPEKDSES
ncbi:hypothetical protein J2W14_000336 [Pseudarthrobacter oxydans]|nr:hypothetical protein [Pseudarthrobacter oxydans]